MLLVVQTRPEKKNPALRLLKQTKFESGFLGNAKTFVFHYHDVRCCAWWLQGHGLGRDKQGITQALEAEKTGQSCVCVCVCMYVCMCVCA